MNEELNQGFDEILFQLSTRRRTPSGVFLLLISETST